METGVGMGDGAAEGQQARTVSRPPQLLGGGDGVHPRQPFDGEVLPAVDLA